MDSAVLAAQLAAGHVAALHELYRREAGAVYRYALAPGGNAARAADATQEAFVALATRPRGFDARATPGAGVARHALTALWRAQRQEAPLDDEGEGDGVAAAAAPPPELEGLRANGERTTWVIVAGKVGNESGSRARSGLRPHGWSRCSRVTSIRASIRAALRRTTG